MSLPPPLKTKVSPPNTHLGNNVNIGAPPAADSEEESSSGDELAFELSLDDDESVVEEEQPGIATLGAFKTSLKAVYSYVAENCPAELREEPDELEIAITDDGGLEECMTMMAE